MYKRVDNPQLVSVILPVYNSENYLSESIESVLEQTYKNIELIVIYDESKDETLNILKKYEKKDSRVKIIQGNGVKRLAGALNLGIKNARGDLIARMDADDISIKNRIEKQIEYLKKGEFDIISCEAINIDFKGKKHSINTNINCTQNYSCRFVTMFENPLLHPGVLSKRKTYNLCEYDYPDGFSTSEDYRLWIDLQKKNIKIGNAPLRLLKYRRTPSGESTVNNIRMNQEHISLAYNFFQSEMDVMVPLDIFSLILCRCTDRINFKKTQKALIKLNIIKNRFLNKYNLLSGDINFKEINHWVQQRELKILVYALIYSKPTQKFRITLLLLQRSGYLCKKKTWINIYSRLQWLYYYIKN